LREFRDFSLKVKQGDVLSVDVFAQGDYVDCIGMTKGRGFEGVVKRHGFHGAPATHGSKGWKRRSGALGCRLFPGTIDKGKRMPGHMGCVRRTVQNLKIVGILPEDNVILVSGCMPGAEGDYVIIRESKKNPKTTVQK
jgi:large subunit ribosomal protein L3